MMESRSLSISLGHKHFFNKQSHKHAHTQSAATSKAKSIIKWNAVRIAQRPIIASASSSCYSCVLAVDGVVGEENLLEKWQRIIDILKDILKPAPNSPAAGGDLTPFLSASAILLLVFWLGNYVVPDMIFKDTVFRKTVGDEDAESSVAESDMIFKDTVFRKTDGDEDAESSVAASEEVVASNANANIEGKAVGFRSKIKSKKKRHKR